MHQCLCNNHCTVIDTKLATTTRLDASVTLGVTGTFMPFFVLLFKYNSTYHAITSDVTTAIKGALIKYRNL